jgi:hypothetical protein
MEIVPGVHVPVKVIVLAAGIVCSALAFYINRQDARYTCKAQEEGRKLHDPYN